MSKNTNAIIDADLNQSSIAKTKNPTRKIKRTEKPVVAKEGEVMEKVADGKGGLKFVPVKQQIQAEVDAACIKAILAETKPVARKKLVAVLTPRQQALYTEALAKQKQDEAKSTVTPPSKKQLKQIEADAKKDEAKKIKQSKGMALSDLLKQHTPSVPGRVARRALRAAAKSGKLKHDHGHGWTFANEQLAVVIDLLEQIAKGGKSITRVTKKAATESTPPKNPIRKLVKKDEPKPEAKAEPVEPLTKQEKNRVGKAIAEAIKSYAEAEKLGSDDSSDWATNVQDDCIGALTEENGIESRSVVAKAEVVRFRQQPLKFQADLIAELVSS